jgi:hypothetical protein
MDTIFPREQIAIAFIGQFNEKGPDASLSAVAKELHISKKLSTATSRAKTIFTSSS